MIVAASGHEAATASYLDAYLRARGCAMMEAKLAVAVALRRDLRVSRSEKRDESNENLPEAIV
jgi:hypothetical protein